MKIAAGGTLVFGALLLSGAAFAQGDAGNAAQDALRQRLQQLKLVNPPKPITVKRMAAVLPTPKACAVPLLKANPQHVEVMPCVQPPALREPEAGVPAPACGETNQP